MRVLSVVGNRPQFVKAAPLSRAIRAVGDEILVHTGQHYDPALADLFFDELGIPDPDHHLGIGAGSPLQQIARVIDGLEPIAVGAHPDVVMVSGDTTTTLAGAIVAAKLDLPIAHVEAGLRSFDRSMPEEQNRVATDHLSRLLFCPTGVAVENLAREGLTDGVHLVGDVMFDASLMFAPAAAARDAAGHMGLTHGEYVLVTVHRAAATDTRDALTGLVEVLRAIGGPAVFPVHPRTRAALERAGLLGQVTSIPDLRLIDPVGYLDFMSLLTGARAVVTDSGGVQKEAYFQGVCCVTVRENTEWVETVEGGFNRLTGMDAGRVAEALVDPSLPTERPSYYGDGHAAEHIAAALAAFVRGE